jgi:hypothetical protein
VTTQIQIRRGTAAQWTAANPVLAEGELAAELDTGKYKIGNGSTAWNSLGYSSGTQGIQGVKGDTGDTGPQGLQGIQGVKGDTGDVSLNGTQTLTNKTVTFAENTLTGVQPLLVSGTNIKTINNVSLLDSGNITTLVSADIGSTVQGYDADTAKLDVAQSWAAQQTFKELKDTVHTITDGAGFEIDPANGSVQVVTLGASRTPVATNFEAGQTVLLGIDDGSAYAITWSSVNPTWVKSGGSASAPTLATTGYTWILLYKVGSVIYASVVGAP